MYWTRGTAAQRAPRRWAVIGSLAAAVAVPLTWAGPWPANLLPGEDLDADSFALLGRTIQTAAIAGTYPYIPPSLVLFCWGVALVSLRIRAAGTAGPAVAPARRPGGWPLPVNMTAMTLYLWHAAALVLAYVTLHALDRNSPTTFVDGFPYVAIPDPGEYAAWWALFFAAYAGFPLLLVLVFWSAEYRPLPWWDAPVRTGVGTSTTTAGQVLLTAVGVFLLSAGLMMFTLEGAGLIVEPGPVPINAATSFLVLLASAACVRTASGRAASADEQERQATAV